MQGPGPGTWLNCCKVFVKRVLLTVSRGPAKHSAYPGQEGSGIRMNHAKCHLQRAASQHSNRHILAAARGHEGVDICQHESCQVSGQYVTCSGHDMSIALWTLHIKFGSLKLDLLDLSDDHGRPWLFEVAFSGMLCPLPSFQVGWWMLLVVLLVLLTVLLIQQTPSKLIIPSSGHPLPHTTLPLPDVFLQVLVDQHDDEDDDNTGKIPSTN